MNSINDALFIWSSRGALKKLLLKIIKCWWAETAICWMCAIIYGKASQLEFRTMSTRTSLDCIFKWPKFRRLKRKYFNCVDLFVNKKILFQLTITLIFIFKGFIDKCNSKHYFSDDFIRNLLWINRVSS